MKYLVVQDWKNTHGNHAGMVHMCRLLTQRYPDQYKMLVKEQPKLFVTKKTMCGQIVRVWNHFVAKPYYLSHTFAREYRNLCEPMFHELKKGDKVFLLEYLLPEAPQISIASYIKSNFPDIPVYALSHLTVDWFKKKINRRGSTILEWSSYVNKMLTLGSSLSMYFEQEGIPRNKISTGFHYVDAEYYHKEEPMKIHAPLRVIAMGSLQRDYSMLAKIVRQTPEIQFIICHGKTDVGNLFSNCENVILKGYLSEDELKHQMDESDVSINIMIDTVGSNVITTSMAMGLAMLASNVGSIGDYCDKDNSILCDNSVASFVSALNYLYKNPDKVMEMRKASLEHSKRLQIEKIHNWFSSL